MGSEINSLFELSVDQYNQLNESGLGKVIYGDIWPANESVFLSLCCRYEASAQLFYVVRNITESTGCSAQQVIEFIQNYGEELGALWADINKGYITQQEIQEIIEDIDNV